MKIAVLGTRLTLAAGAFSFGIGEPAKAQHMNASDAPCQEAGSMVDISNCYVAELEKADATLNETYGSVMRVMGNEDKVSAVSALRSAQRAWIIYRDKGCEAEADLYNGGSGKGIARLACQRALTIQRTEAIRQGFWWQVEKFGDGQ